MQLTDRDCIRNVLSDALISDGFREIENHSHEGAQLYEFARIIGDGFLFAPTLQFARNHGRETFEMIYYLDVDEIGSDFCASYLSIILSQTYLARKLHLFEAGLQYASQDSAEAALELAERILTVHRVINARFAQDFIFPKPLGQLTTADLDCFQRDPESAPYYVSRPLVRFALVLGRVHFRLGNFETIRRFRDWSLCESPQATSIHSEFTRLLET